MFHQCCHGRRKDIPLDFVTDVEQKDKRGWGESHFIPLFFSCILIYLLQNRKENFLNWIAFYVIEASSQVEMKKINKERARISRFSI